jgi:hypothetical protein
MIPRRLVGRGCQLLLAAGLSLAAALQAHAQTLPAGKNPDAVETAAPDANDADARDADAKDADVENLQLDWSLLNVDASTLITTPSKARPATQAANADMSWSSKDKSNGAAAVSVKPWFNLGQDGGRSAGRSLAGTEQAGHLPEQVAAPARAIFADPAERLQRHPAGCRPGARHPGAPGAKL